MSPQQFSENISSKLPKIKAEYRAAARVGLVVAGDHVLGVSNERAPIERGMAGGLISTGQSTVADDELRAAVSYDAPHAVRQHEDLSYKHDSGRRAKYLESAMADESGTVGQIIAEAIRRKMGA